MSESLKKKVFSGAIWMSSISLLQQIFQFLVQIVLARLLVPKDYGTAAIVMSLCMFAVVFSSAGIGTALVQKKELTSKITDAAATITGGLALVLGSVVFFGSNWIATFYKLPELSLLFQIAAFDIFFKVMISLYDGLILREMRFRLLSLMSFISLLIQAGVSITLAFTGHGAKSLVIGYLSGSLIHFIFCLFATKYIPRSFGNWREAVGVFQFGGWILLGRVANQAAITLDQLILGKFLNVASLGLINISKNLSSLIPHTILGFANRLTLPVFSQWQDNLQRVEINYWRGVRIQLLIITPLCVIIAFASYQILGLLFGVKWIDGNMVMKIYAMQAIVWSAEGGLTSAVFNALGKPKFGTVVMILSLGLIPLCAYIGALFGITGVAVAFLCFAIIVLLVNQYILWLKFNFKISNWFLIATRQLLAILPLLICGYGLVVSGLLPFTPPPELCSSEWFLWLLRLIVFGLVGMTIYLISAKFLLKEDFEYLMNGILSLIKRKK